MSTGPVQAPLMPHEPHVEGGVNKITHPLTAYESKAGKFFGVILTTFLSVITAGIVGVITLIMNLNRTWRIGGTFVHNISATVASQLTQQVAQGVLREPYEIKLQAKKLQVLELDAEKQLEAGQAKLQVLGKEIQRLKDEIFRLELQDPHTRLRNAINRLDASLATQVKNLDYFERAGVQTPLEEKQSLAMLRTGVQNINNLVREIKSADPDIKKGFEEIEDLLQKAEELSSRLRDAIENLPRLGGGEWALKEPKVAPRGLTAAERRAFEAELRAEEEPLLSREERKEMTRVKIKGVHEDRSLDAKIDRLEESIRTNRQNLNDFKREAQVLSKTQQRESVEMLRSGAAHLDTMIRDVRKSDPTAPVLKEATQLSDELKRTIPKFKGMLAEGLKEGRGVYEEPVAFGEGVTEAERRAHREELRAQERPLLGEQEVFLFGENELVLEDKERTTALRGPQAKGVKAYDSHALDRLDAALDRLRTDEEMSLVNELEDLIDKGAVKTNQKRTNDLINNIQKTIKDVQNELNIYAKTPEGLRSVYVNKMEAEDVISRAEDAIRRAKA